MNFWLKYGVADSIRFVPTIDAGKADILMVPTFAAGQVQVSKDGNATVDIATLPVVAPTASGFLNIALSAGELTCKQLGIRFVDDATKDWEDFVVIVHTYGHASSQHPNFGRDQVPLLAATQASIDDTETDVTTILSRVTAAVATAANLLVVDAVADAIKLVTDALPDSGALTAISTDTARLTAARAGALTDWLDGERLDTILDGVPANVTSSVFAHLTDGVSLTSFAEAVMAVLFGKATVDLGPPVVVSFMLRDGTTPKVNVTLGGEKGERDASVIV